MRSQTEGGAFPAEVKVLFEERISPGSTGGETEELDASEGEVIRAVDVVIRRLVDVCGTGAEPRYGTEACALIASEDEGAFVSAMEAIPRMADPVPDNLVGALELMLRAAKSGARLGPATFGLSGLTPETWRHLRAAERKGMTSHHLLTLWATID